MTTLPRLLPDVELVLEVALENLPPDVLSRLETLLGDIGHSPASWDNWTVEQRRNAMQLANEHAANLAREIKEERQRRKLGRYKLFEAAEHLELVGENKRAIRRKLERAIMGGTLPVFLPGEFGRHMYENGTAVRWFYEELYWDDLNQWLDANEPRIFFRFTAPVGQSLIATVTPEQSRHPESEDREALPCVATIQSFSHSGEEKLRIGSNSIEAIRAYIVEQSKAIFATGEVKSKSEIAQKIANEMKTLGYRSERSDLSVARIERLIPAGITGGRGKNRRKAS